MPQELSAIDNAGSNFCVRSAKGGEGHLLYSMDVVCNGNHEKSTPQVPTEEYRLAEHEYAEKK